MKSGNIAQLTEQLDGMIEKLGIEKLSAEGPIGESAGIIADPGTSQPAKQEAAKANIQPATEGAQSASNNSMLKEEVPGDNTATANPADADNSGAASSTENTTTATLVGGDSKVEDGYGSRQQTLDAPSTTHPADVNKDPEKYSADLRESASLIDQEIEKLSAATAESDVTVGDRIGELLLGKEASAEEKDEAVLGSVKEYLGGYAKTASLVGEMTSDALDIMIKESAGEEMPMDPAMGAEGMPPEAMAAEGEGIPAEALEAGAEGGELEGGDEAAALAEAAEMVAAELGVTPEEVLEAAVQELAEGGGEEGGMPMEEGMPAEGEVPAEELPPEEGAIAEEEAAKMASVTEELTELRKQSAELKQIKEAQAKVEGDTHLQTLVASAVRSELETMTKAPSA